ncbi:MAG TPA: iron-sulfur cluster repair di-iron protein [Eubacteriaceae bacterium]|nr:iron-sulfur cluster repair di-iron protein [Eubacteriaceae bacterium]
MKTIERNQTLGEIVTHFPKAAEIFKAHRIDFCCGGDRTLAQAAKEDEVNEKTLLNTLNEQKEKLTETASVQYVDMDNGQLIDHIVNTHHSYLNRELPVISALSQKVLKAHGENHPELFDVFKDFHALKSELEQHLIKEEVPLFPAMLKADNDADLQTEIEDEHEGAGDLLKKLRQENQDFTVPKDACESYSLLYKKLEELESDVFQHVHLENNILFQRF